MDERRAEPYMPDAARRRQMTMRNMRWMRRAAPPARAAHEMAMRNMRWMRRAAPAAAQTETPGS